MSVERHFLNTEFGLLFSVKLLFQEHVFPLLLVYLGEEYMILFLDHDKVWQFEFSFWKFFVLSFSFPMLSKSKTFSWIPLLIN
jgi:hypothetical protein